MPRPGRLVLFVGEACACAGLRLYDYLVAVVDQFADAVGLHADAAFLVFDLFWYPYNLGHFYSLHSDSVKDAPLTTLSTADAH